MKDILEFECITCGFKSTTKQWIERHLLEEHNEEQV